MNDNYIFRGEKENFAFKDIKCDSGDNFHEQTEKFFDVVNIGFQQFYRT